MMRTQTRIQDPTWRVVSSQAAARVNIESNYSEGGPFIDGVLLRNAIGPFPRRGGGCLRPVEALCGIAEVEKAKGFVLGAEAEECLYFVRVDDRRGGPEGREAEGGGGEVHVLDRAGDGFDFFDPGDLFDFLTLHADGDDGAGPGGIDGKLLELVLAEGFFRGDLLIGATENVREFPAGFSFEDGESPGLGEAMGGGPVGVLKDGVEVATGDWVGAHVRRFDRAAVPDVAADGDEILLGGGDGHGQLRHFSTCFWDSYQGIKACGGLQIFAVDR